jgi:threonine aldolase
VLAHRDAHVCTDETGAPGLFGHGIGLIPLDGPSGRIDPSSLTPALTVPDASYRQSPAALSLTNATEYGTVYTPEALRALTDIARARGLPVHLDGARLANALASGFPPRALKDLGLDMLVIGGTKNGMTPTEALVLFNPGLSRRFDARLKQMGQLPSKGRFYSAPWIGMLRDGAFLRHAAHANAMARLLAAGMPFPLRHSVDANGVFVEMDDAAHQRLTAEGWFVYRFTDGSIRFMCSWSTTEADVEALLDSLRRIA